MLGPEATGEFGLELGGGIGGVEAVGEGWELRFERGKYLSSNSALSEIMVHFEVGFQNFQPL